jgi:chromosomal replication initiation ATPase DnaA
MDRKGDTVGWAPAGGRFGFDGTGRFLEGIVALAFGVRAEALRAETRGRSPVAAARQVGMYLAHTRLHLRYEDAGAFFSRDRTTAAHACRRVEDRREDTSFDSLLDCLERAIDVWAGSSG